MSSYSRPASLVEALALLERPTAVALGGGTRVNAAAAAEPVELVDLQALGLDRIEPLSGGAVRLGATVRLQQLAESCVVPPAVREAARREQPSTLRSQATLGGAVATADPESELLAALLVHDAVASVAGSGGSESLPLTELFAQLPLAAGRVITAVTIDVTGRSAVARVGRTEADRPIVAAAARVTDDGDLRLALSGVAATPVLVDGLDELEPPDDFRGSSEYRRALAEVLSERVLELSR